MQYLLILYSLIALLETSCTPIRQRSSDLKELGVIADPMSYGGKFNPEFAKMGVLKLCHFENYTRCLSATVLNREGYVLTAGHTIQNFTGSSPKITPELNQTVSQNVKLVSGYFDLSPADKTKSFANPSYLEPEVFEFDLVFVGDLKKFLAHDSEDLALLRVKADQLERFNRWTYPLPVEKSFGRAGNYDPIRVFLASYPWPYLYEADLRKIEQSAIGSEYGLNVQKRFPSNFDFALYTGVLSTEKDRDIRYWEGNHLLESNRAEVVGPFDQKAHDGAWGSSGGALLTEEGKLIGIHLMGDSDRASESKEEKNIPIADGQSLSTAQIDKLIDFDKFQPIALSATNLEVQRQQQISELEALMLAKSKELNLYLESVYEKFRKFGKTKLSYSTDRKQELSAYCESLGWEPDQYPTDRVINYNYYQVVRAVEIEIVSPSRSRLRYRSSDRSDRDKWYKIWKDNGWSPWFDFHTARLLARTRVGQLMDREWKGIMLKGFGPFFVFPELMDKFPRLDKENGPGRIKFLTMLLETVIGGLYPTGKVHPDEPIDYWAISQCTRGLGGPF